MSHSDLNPVNPAKPKRAAIVISNAAVSTSTGWPVGFWWSELTHPHYAFTEAGWQTDIYSPDGGNCAWDAMSDPDDAGGWQAEDQISRGYKNDPAFRRHREHPPDRRARRRRLRRAGRRRRPRPDVHLRRRHRSAPQVRLLL